MKTSKFTDCQIMTILKQAEAGTPVPELCREHGMSSATFYKWRAKFGGMDASLMARLKELEAENARLKKMYAEERLKAEIIQEAMAQHAVANRNVTIRMACAAFCISQTCYRYQPVNDDENAQIADLLIDLTELGVWPVFSLPAQRERFWLEPQAGLPNLLRFGAEFAHKTTQTTQTKRTRTAERTHQIKPSVVDRLYA